MTQGSPATAVVDRVLFAAFAALLLLAPLPFASNRLWSWSLLGVVIGGLMVVWTLAVATRRQSCFLDLRRLVPAALLFALVVAVIVLQAVCWTPAAWQNDAWDLARHLDDGLCGSISIDPYATWTALARLLTYAGAFWLALQLGGSGRRTRQLLNLVGIAGAAYAAYGLAVYFSGSETILWYRKWAYQDYLTSTFVNRNSFAVFAGMAATCNFALLLQAAVPSAESRRGWHPTLARLASHGHVPLACFVLCMSAIVLTASRAGLVATVLGLMALTVLWSVRLGRGSARRSLGLTLGIGGLLLFLLLAGGALVDRMGQIEDDAGSRQMVLSTVSKAIADRPWLGVGYGTFPDAWRAYRPAGVYYRYNQAHSTYLENIFELGVPGALMLFASVGLVMALALGGAMKRQRDAILPLAALCACLVPVIHSTIDFSLQIPAVTLLFAALLGLAFRQSYRTAARSGNAQREERAPES